MQKEKRENEAVSVIAWIVSLFKWLGDITMLYVLSKGQKVKNVIQCST